jgi:hypothetical protein
MRQADSHGERADDRADAYRCQPHSRHNDGRDPCSLRAVDAIPNSRHEAMQISMARLLKGPQTDSERFRWETIAPRLDALGAGNRKRYAEDESPPALRRRKATARRSSCAPPILLLQQTGQRNFSSKLSFIFTTRARHLIDAWALKFKGSASEKRPQRSRAFGSLASCTTLLVVKTGKVGRSVSSLQAAAANARRTERNGCLVQASDGGPSQTR